MFRFSPMSTSQTPDPSRYPFIKVIWGSSEVIKAGWHLGLFGFYSHLPGLPRSGFVVSVRGVVCWVLALGVSGYLAVVGVVGRRLARDPFNQIGISDLLAWPVRRERIAELRGRAWVAQGFAAFEARRWGEGVFLMRAGLERCPDAFDARLALAEIYLRAGERTRALALLADGPSFGMPPRRWLEKVLDTAAAGEDWHTSLKICDLCLERLSAPAQWADRQWLIARKQAALIGLGRAREALDLADAAGATATELVDAQRVRALLALGRAPDAVAFLSIRRSLVRAESVPAVVRLQVQALREAGQGEAMEQSLAELRRLVPGAASAAFAVEQRALLGRGAMEALEDYLFRFGGTVSNLRLLSASLAEISDVSLVRRVTDAARAAGYDLWPFQVQLAQALLRQGDWSSLVQAVHELKARRLSADDEGRLWFDWIDCLSDDLALPTAATRQRLIEFVQTRSFSLSARRLTVSALRRAGRLGTAREVIAASRRTYPESPWLQTQAAEVDLAIAAMVQMPQPVVTGGSVAAGVPANWRKYFQDLDTSIVAKDWTEARRQIALVRRAAPPPEWLPTRDGELLFRELRVAQGLRDGPSMRLTLDLFLNGSLSRAVEILDFARELHATGEHADAVLLLKVLLQKHPEHPVASAFLTAWQPRAVRTLP